MDSAVVLLDSWEDIVTKSVLKDSMEGAVEVTVSVCTTENATPLMGLVNVKMDGQDLDGRFFVKDYFLI